MHKYIYNILDIEFYYLGYNSVSSAAFRPMLDYKVIVLVIYKDPNPFNPWVCTT